MLLGLLLTLVGCTSASPTAPAATASAPSATANGGSQPPAATATTADSSSSATSAPSMPLAPGEPSVAVQTVLAYYQALNANNIDGAYRLWANDGAASQQSLSEFTQGFSSTVSTEILLAEPQVLNQPNQVQVPLTILAVINDPSVPQLGQRAQQFSGSYTIDTSDPADGLGTMLSANIAPVEPLQIDPSLSDPRLLVQSFYQAINQHQYGRAFTYWNNNGVAAQQPFSDFKQGYASTAEVKVDVGQPTESGAAGSVYADVPVTITSTQTDGSQTTYCGTYTLRRANLPPFDQLGWHISQAQIAAQSATNPCQ